MIRAEIMKYKIADLIIEYEPKYNLLKEHSEKYMVNAEGNLTDISINITDKKIEELKLICEDEPEENLTIEETIEYVHVGNKFSSNLIDCKGCVLHASAIVINNEAYLFSAESGIGKSTHTGLWLKYFKDTNPYILNADKPAIRIFDEGIYVYGTPFTGNVNISENKKVKLKAITFLVQAKTNKITRLNKIEAIETFFSLTNHILEKEKLLKIWDTIEIIADKIPMYKLECNISEEAARLSYETMKK